MKLDQKLLSSVSAGYEVLGDCLDWLSTQKKLKVAKHARATVESHMKYYCPALPVESNDTLPGDLEGLVASIPMLSTEANAKRLMVFHLDFNIPNDFWHDKTCPMTACFVETCIGHVNSMK